MAKSDEAKTTKLTFGTGDKAVTVSVSEEKATRLLGGTGFSKTTSRTTKSD